MGFQAGVTCHSFVTKKKMAFLLGSKKKKKLQTKTELFNISLLLRLSLKMCII